MDSLPYSYSIKLRDEIMKQVMVVRTDLKMGKGKIAAQCCHACLGAYKKCDKDKIRNGRTQVPESTITVLGLGPDEDEILDKLTGDLKLL